MKEIYIIRHGQTDYNKNGIIQGRGINASLNEQGRRQARLFYQSYRDRKFEKIYTSSLKRTIETVQPFIQTGIPFEKRPELDEIDWGKHEGKKATELMQGEYKEIVKNWAENELDICIPGGESPLDLQFRQKRFVMHILRQPEWKVLICSHGRAMRSLLCTMTGVDLCRMDEFPHSNLSLYKVILRDNEFEVDVFNETAHLNGTE